MEPQVIRMYPNGPYRLFSEERFLGAVPYRDSVRQGFVGAFVCELCQKQVRDVLVAANQWYRLQEGGTQRDGAAS